MQSHLSTWLSFEDLTLMLESGLKAPELGCHYSREEPAP